MGPGTWDRDIFKKTDLRERYMTSKREQRTNSLARSIEQRHHEQLASIKQVPGGFINTPRKSHAHQAKKKHKMGTTKICFTCFLHRSNTWGMGTCFVLEVSVPERKEQLKNRPVLNRSNDKGRNNVYSYMPNTKPTNPRQNHHETNVRAQSVVRGCHKQSQ